MNLRRFISRAISETVSVGRIATQATPGFRVLMYHAVGAPAINDKLGIYSISPELFKEHIRALVSLPDTSLVPFQINHATTSSLKVAITFDDGYKDNLHVAAPILVENGIPFTVFIATSFVKERANNFLTPEELKELALLPGVTIGSHGVTHVPLTSCNEAQLADELESSKKYLEDLLGTAINSIAYPHGAVNGKVKQAAARAGYTIGGCSRMGVNNNIQDPLALDRTDILGIDSTRVFRQKLHGDWDWYKWRNIASRDKG